MLPFTGKDEGPRSEDGFAPACKNALDASDGQLPKNGEAPGTFQDRFFKRSSLKMVVETGGSCCTARTLGLGWKRAQAAQRRQ